MKIDKRKIIFLLLIIIFIIILLILLPKTKKKKIYTIETDNIAFVNEIYIYGNHLNIKGTIDNIKNIDKIALYLYGENKIEIPLKYNKNEEGINFKINDKLNNGYLIDNIDIGEYNLYVKITNNNKEKYYKLNNDTRYNETEYYSIRKNNTMKKYNFKNLYDTINLVVKNDKNDDIYDIVIDPGHGGIDKGACNNGFCETDFNYKISAKIKEQLEEKGYKVKLTRKELDSKEKLPNYGNNGRVNIANNASGKYLFSIHQNSNTYEDSGVEVYTANNVDYEFAKKIAKSIVTNAETNFSTNTYFKVDKGVYMRTLLDTDLNESYQDAISDGYEPYDINKDTTYYFIIRETGGYMSGAYKDGRDGLSYNNKVNSNVGSESYLLELGYMTSKDDVNNLSNNMDNYVNGIVNAIIDEIENGE